MVVEDDATTLERTLAEWVRSHLTDQMLHYEQNVTAQRSALRVHVEGDDLYQIPAGWARARTSQKPKVPLPEAVLATL